MITEASITVRHPRAGEVPAELMTGLDMFPIDTDWQWVLIHDGQVKAQLLAVKAHGLLFIMRLTSLPDAPYGWAVKLFRQVMKDAKEAGLIGFMTFLADQNPQEVKLMKIVQRLGGIMIPQSGVWAAGSVEVKY